MPRLFHFLLALLPLSAVLQAEPPLYHEARQALSESLPRVAIVKLRPLLATPGLTPEETAAATLLLGRSLAAEGQYDEALTLIQPQVAAGERRAIHLRANVLAALGRWAEARPLYHIAASLPEAGPSASVGEAEALQALGQTEEAADLLEGVVRSGRADKAVWIRWAVLLAELRRIDQTRLALREIDPTTPEEVKWKSYAEARLLMQQDQPAPALRLFQDILERREAVPESLLAAATFGATEAETVLQGTQSADDELEAFIWHYPTNRYLEAAFRRLDDIYTQEEENASEAELRKWALKPQPRRAALAWFYLAKMQARKAHWENAAKSLETFLQRFPEHALCAEAWLLQAEVLSAQGDLTEVVSALESAARLTEDPALRSTIELRTGLAQYQQGEFLLAANVFEAAALHWPKLRPVATFDAALAWLHLHNAERFHQQFSSFIQQEPESPLRGELILEEGLEQARAGDPQAAASLQAFLRDFPASPRQAEARLALAELRFQAGAAPAPEYLQVANPAAAPEISAQSEYLAIVLADAQQPRDDAKAIALARRFLQERPDASQVPEVRMKLGQIYFRREDFANAETQFATLAEGAPGPYTEAALFLAGQSAMKLINPGAVDRALASFDRVVKLDGPFKLYARQEQAIVQSRLEHEDQAIALYDLILASPQVDRELWQAALCGKGDNLLALGRRAQPAGGRLQEAIAVYDQLAGSPDVGPVWRNQALYKKAKALELLGQGDEALAAFYDVLNGPTAPEREYFWYYKAGFDAARAYEQQEKWKSAIGIYQKMARLEGPRTAEAQSRLRQLRLEHFIWD